MHEYRPLAQLPYGAAPRKKLGLRVRWVALLGAAVLSAGAWGAAAPGDKQLPAQAKEAAPADFVGGEVCATCHSAEAKDFANDPHTKMALEHGKSGVTCEGCHGAGKAHSAGEAHSGGGDANQIFSPAKATAKEVDAMCLRCHAEEHPNFDRSPHAKAKVGCTSCHSIHANGTAAHLLKAVQPTLCFQCHTDVKAAFSMPFHHKVNEGLIQCSDCHDVHSTFGNNNLRSTADQNAICTKCHTDTRGPFVYEHAAVKAEGCLGCHTPHGSQNPRLMTMPTINTLCNQCHSPVSAGTVHGMNAGSAELTPCIDCHTYIHGSNVNPAFLR